jgi:hypothetical protein
MWSEVICGRGDFDDMGPVCSLIDVGRRILIEVSRQSITQIDAIKYSEKQLNLIWKKRLFDVCVKCALVLPRSQGADLSGGGIASPPLEGG